MGDFTEARNQKPKEAKEPNELAFEHDMCVSKVDRLDRFIQCHAGAACFMMRIPSKATAMPPCQALQRCVQCRAFDPGRDNFLADCGFGCVLLHGRPIFPPLRSQETVRSFPALISSAHEK